MDCKFHYKLSAKRGGAGGKGIAHSVQGLVVGEGKRNREREKEGERESAGLRLRHVFLAPRLAFCIGVCGARAGKGISTYAI